jgi:hypothetical protein
MILGDGDFCSDPEKIFESSHSLSMRERRGRAVLCYTQTTSVFLMFFPCLLAHLCVSGCTHAHLSAFVLNLHLYLIGMHMK